MPLGKLTASTLIEGGGGQLKAFLYRYYTAKSFIKCHQKTFINVDLIRFLFWKLRKKTAKKDAEKMRRKCGKTSLSTTEKNINIHVTKIYKRCYK